MNDEQNSENIGTKPKDNLLKSFIERIERLEEEKNNIIVDIKEIYYEAKNSGYDPKITRKTHVYERLEDEALLDTYRNASGIF